MTAMTNIESRKLWYKEPWPWILMAGPAIVIVAAFYTAWLAVTSADGLVTDDYYKQGQQAGEVLAQSRKAQEMELHAFLRLNREAIHIRLEAKPDATLPPTLNVMLSHPTRAGLDQKMKLPKTGNDYSGHMLLPAAGHWLILIEDEARTWRVMGSIMLPAAGETAIGGAPVPDQRQS